MSDSSPSLLSLDEPALEAATTPPPPPQPGEHSMRLRSQGPEPHRSTLDAHLRGHIHTDLAEGEIPTVQTPRRILHGPATPFSDSVGTRSTSRSASPDGSAATRSAGGRTSPEPVLPTTALPAPDDDAATQLDFEFGATPLVVTPLAGRDTAHPAARSPVLGSGGLDIDALPDLEEPNALTEAIAWRSTFVKHAGVDVTPAVRAKAIANEANQRKAATLRHRLRLLLSDGVAENDAAARAAESAVLAPAARTTVMATFAAAVDDLPDLVDPVDSFVWRETFMKHARHADTALAEFNRELDSRFGPADSPRRHHGELWSRQVLPPASKLFPNVDSTNLRVDTTHRARFGAQRFPAEGRHDDDEPPYDGGRWAPGHSPRAPTPACPYPVNTYRPSDAQYHGGSEGYCPLTPALIHRCGYTAINTVDVISSYNKIVLVHESVITNWVGRFTVGPQIDRILEKALVSLPRLQSLAVESAVEWYDAL